MCPLLPLHVIWATGAAEGAIIRLNSYSCNNIGNICIVTFATHISRYNPEKPCVLVYEDAPC